MKKRNIDHVINNNNNNKLCKRDNDIDVTRNDTNDNNIVDGDAYIRHFIDTVNQNNGIINYHHSY